MRMLSRGFYNVIVHSFGFTCLFTAFQTSSGFQATILKDVLGKPQLGNQSLAIIYIVFALANFIAPPIAAKLGNRLSMVLASAGYAGFIATFLKPEDWSILAVSVVLGLAAAVLWTAQGSFITENTTDSNRGAYSGIFWAMLQSSLLIGNLFAYFALKGETVTKGKAEFMYQVLFGVACGGVLTLCFLRRSPADQEKHSVGMREVCISRVQTPFPCTKGLEAAINSKTPPTADAPLNTMQLIGSTFKLLVAPDMLCLSVLIMYTGIEQTFWGAKYPTLIGDAFQPRTIGLSGITVGVAEIVGGMTMGRIADRFGRSWVVMVTVFSHSVAFFLVYLNMQSNLLSKPDLALALCSSFLLGFGDSAVNTALYAELGERFNQKSAQAFALFKFFQSATAAASNFYAPLVYTPYQLIILMVFLLPGAYLFQRTSKAKPVRSAGYMPIDD